MHLKLKLILVHCYQRNVRALITPIDWMLFYSNWGIRLTEAFIWILGHGRHWGHQDSCGGRRGRRWKRGGNLGVKFLAPVGGAAVAEGPDAVPALCDVEGASGAGVRHWDVSEAVLTAAALQLLLKIILWRQKKHTHTILIQLVCFLCKCTNQLEGPRISS